MAACYADNAWTELGGEPPAFAQGGPFHLAGIRARKIPYRGALELH
jgi:hypothetical protein